MLLIQVENKSDEEGRTRYEHKRECLGYLD